MLLKGIWLNVFQMMAAVAARVAGLVPPGFLAIMSSLMTAGGVIVPIAAGALVELDIRLASLLRSALVDFQCQS